MKANFAYLWRRLKHLFEKWHTVLLVGVLLLIVWGLFRPAKDAELSWEPFDEELEPEIEATTEIAAPSSSNQATLGLCRCYVSGAVLNPGVYTLENGALLIDLVEAAGGLLADAEPSVINLAQEIIDQAHYHVPYLGDDASVQNAGKAEAFYDGRFSDSESGGGINLNTASQEELQTLTGIGPSLAERIVEWRDAYGPFQSNEELMLVPGIKEAKFQALEKDLAPLP